MPSSGQHTNVVSENSLKAPFLTPANELFLISDYVRNITSVNDDILKLSVGPGIYHSMWQMFLAILFYMAMLVITFGIKIPCGLFIPSLVIGALTGSCLAKDLSHELLIKSTFVIQVELWE